MKKLETQELLQIVGGINLTASFFTTLLNGGKFLYEVGQSVGSAIRRSISKTLCPIS